ncbi:MAG: hypothetical protein ACKOYM_09970 [Actinomycetes bacterium]
MSTSDDLSARSVAAGPDEPRSWRQVPASLPSTTSWEAAMLAWVLTAVSTLMWLHLAWRSFIGAVLVALVVALLLHANWVVGIGATLLAAPLTIATLSGRPEFAWVPVLMPVLVLYGVLVGWSVATGSIVPMWPRWPTSPARRLVVLAMAGVSASLVVQSGVRLPLLMLALAAATVVVCIVAPVPVSTAMARLDPIVGGLRPLVRANHRLVERVGQFVGAVVGCIAMVPVALVTAWAWLVQRVFRFDPLDPPAFSGSRWVIRTGGDSEPDRSFARLTVREPRSVGYRLMRFGSGIVTLVVGCALVFTAVSGVRLMTAGAGFSEAVQAVARRVPSALNCRSGLDAAMDGQSNWPLVGCETTDFVNKARFDATTIFRYEDFQGKWVNVTDGVRRTWQPPPCDDCRRLRVWWFGGSVAWGFYQGDMTSLPSMVARAAWERGVALEIVNYATPGWTLGQSVRKFSQLAATQTPPDLAVFVDGANDLSVQFSRNHQGSGANDGEASFVEGSLDEVLRYGRFDAGLDHVGAALGGTGSALSDREVGEHAVRRYARNVRVGRAVTSAVGTSAVFFLQPVAVSGPRRLVEEGSIPPIVLNELRGAWPAVRRGIPAGVQDLSDAFDDVDRLIYKDQVHTNEFGANVLARRIFTDLQPAISEAQQRPPRT